MEEMEVHKEVFENALDLRFMYSHDKSEGDYGQELEELYDD